MIPAPTREEIIAAASRQRDREFAAWLAAAIILAAEIEPDMIRDALARVFDTRATLAAARSADKISRGAAHKAHELAAEVRALVTQIDKDIDRIEKRIDAIA